MHGNVDLVDLLNHPWLALLEAQECCLLLDVVIEIDHVLMLLLLMSEVA